MSDPVYLSGLMLRDRDVLVVGGGRVATRRSTRLLEAGAAVRVVSPDASAAIQAAAAEGRLAWSRRDYAAGDVGDAWYVLAATNDPQVNAAVAREAEARHVFCVRADSAEGGSAWTPATGHASGMVVGVVGRNDPVAARVARDAAVTAVDGALDLSGERLAKLGSGTLAQLLPGTVTLVGGGPGDLGLLTVAGLAAIRQADVIAYDNLAPIAALAEARPGAQLIDVGKLPRGAFTPQERINELLIEHAGAGRRVVRLKGGDPFVLGRGGEEWVACAAAGVPVRVLPGVTSAVAAPALAGVAVTHRGLSQGFTMVSGHVPPGDPRSSVDWPALAGSGTTLVVLMGVSTLPAIADTLLAAGMAPDTPAAVVERAGLEGMRTVRGTLATIAADAVDVRPPAVTVIGAVAGLVLAD